MPKHNFMISRAVDLVARKLAGMDTETISRLTQVLSEEAQMISEELQYSGQNVDSEVLAAKLEGLVARMKYEARNQEHDPSPHEFPIFNVSHNPASPYPNPINHLYDRRYKDAYSTFIKQNQAPPPSSQQSQPSTPNLPAPSSSTKPPNNPNPTVHQTYPQGQYQQQSNNRKPPPPGFITDVQQQQQQQQQQLPNGWHYPNPYAAMPPSQPVYYRQSSTTNNTQPSTSSSTGHNVHANPISRSASSNDLNYPTVSGKEKIRVRVINDSSASSLGDSQMSTLPSSRATSPRSVLQSNSGISRNNNNNNNEMVTTRRIYASPHTEITPETMDDLLKVVQNQQSAATRSSAAPMTERVIIIDRRGSSGQDNNPNSSGNDRYRAFEIRTSSAAGGAPSSPSTVVTTTPRTPTATTNSTVQGLQQPNYFAGQQLFYQQPRMYSSVPNNLFATATPYVSRVNGFYPFAYFQY